MFGASQISLLAAFVFTALAGGTVVHPPLPAAATDSPPCASDHTTGQDQDAPRAWHCRLRNG